MLPGLTAPKLKAQQFQEAILDTPTSIFHQPQMQYFQISLPNFPTLCFKEWNMNPGHNTKPSFTSPRVHLSPGLLVSFVKCQQNPFLSFFPHCHCPSREVHHLLSSNFSNPHSHSHSSNQFSNPRDINHISPLRNSETNKKKKQWNTSILTAIYLNICKWKYGYHSWKVYTPMVTQISWKECGTG